MNGKYMNETVMPYVWGPGRDTATVVGVWQLLRVDFVRWLRWLFSHVCAVHRRDDKHRRVSEK